VTFRKPRKSGEEATQKMKTLTVRFDEDVRAIIEEEAEKRKWSKATWIEDLVINHLKSIGRIPDD
jgi:predicted HicB family RNase H-like nuclease